MNYIEMHSHIKEQSSDSHVSGSEYVELLLEKGYKVLVTTDHFSDSELSLTSGVDLIEKCNNWLSGYKAALKAAKETGLTVLLGMEYNLESVNPYIDILLYGLTEDIVCKGLIQPNMPLNKLRSLCKEHDILMIQAHPERYGHHRLPVEFIDGYEIKNTKTREQYNDSYNVKIQEFVKSKPNLICTGGSDSHYNTDVGLGGIYTDREINDICDLKKVLKTRDYYIVGL